MSFVPFDQDDFSAMNSVEKDSLPKSLESKSEDLRRDLGKFPEFELDFFRDRIVRRPNMRGRDGLVFGPPRAHEEHWYLYVAGGDQDQVQLNIGMFPDYIRVGLGFQIGRRVAPKAPRFHLFQLFLGHRPPLPFRDAFLGTVREHGFRIQGVDATEPEEVVSHLEEYVVPADDSPVFVFVGKLWTPDEAQSKDASDYRTIFQALLPYYEELLLAGGRYEFHI